MKLKRGDVVVCKKTPYYPGLVKRVARDGSWADVDWGTHSKRMPTQSLVKPREVRVPGLEPWDGALTAWLIQPDGDSGVVVDVPKL